MATLSCRICGATIEADNEDELVDRMQAHASDEHAKHHLSRQHILRHLNMTKPSSND